MTKKNQQGRSKRDRKHALARRATAEAELLDALRLLGQRREPYGDLLAGIVDETLRRFPALPTGPIVELGAGAGQLRRWLSDAHQRRLVHTDPSAAALGLLRQHAPDADTRVATAQKLPFADGACGGAWGLCVFDAIHAHGAEAAVVDELGRVLAPGAPFVHFLDMATLLERPFAKLAAEDLVPIPNVFGDPGEHEWPLDIVLFKRDWLTGLLDFGARMQHPLVTVYGDYFATFLSRPFAVREATNLFKSVAARGDLRHALAIQIASLSQVAVQRGYPAVPAIPFHSGRYLASVLEATFAGSALFRVELAEIVTRAAWRPPAAAGVDVGAPLVYRSLCVGHERTSEALPGRVIDAAARAALASGFAPPDQVLCEAGMFVFVARRV
ncbi:MAG: class I SAM-dependent methyltransferase [Verrucomicrobiota bacterium]